MANEKQLIMNATTHYDIRGIAYAYFPGTWK